MTINEVKYIAGVKGIAYHIGVQSPDRNVEWNDDVNECDLRNYGIDKNKNYNCISLNIDDNNVLNCYLIVDNKNDIKEWKQQRETLDRQRQALNEKSKKLGFEIYEIDKKIEHAILVNILNYPRVEKWKVIMNDIVTEDRMYEDVDFNLEDSCISWDGITYAKKKEVLLNALDTTESDLYSNYYDKYGDNFVIEIEWKGDGNATIKSIIE